MRACKGGGEEREQTEREREREWSSRIVIEHLRHAERRVARGAALRIRGLHVLLKLAGTQETTRGCHRRKAARKI